MNFEGVVTNGTIVLDNDAQLPEGTRVEVAVKAPPIVDESSSLGFMLKYAGIIDDWPSDMARNHDHYLHGAPKR